ncbi:DUF3850 domain-containing protein [Pseudomonas fulva]|uniref:DUF3850 domain-containing protein n=2 Tax=Pseudomonas fulva TaxID=47880 RepID=UPI003D9B5D97
MVSVPRVHELKIRQTPLADLLSGLKTGEIRDCSDREFTAGDTVLLREIDDDRAYTGRVERRTITHVQKQYGLPDHLCVLSYGQPAPHTHPDPIAWMVGTAFWWTKEEAERDAAETGLPIVGLGPMTGATPADLQQVEPVALAIPDECPHIIVFDDADSANEHFVGAGARTAALRRYEQISQSWNAHLFVRIARNSRDDRYPSAAVAEPAEVERLRGEIRRLHEAGEFLDNVNQGIEDKLRAQLAEAQALLRTQDDLLSQAYQHDIGTTLKREIRAAALPTSAEAQVKS